MFYSEKDDREKQLRFSIRKVSFGAASVAVAALYLFMGSGAVSAAEAQAIQSNEEVAADKDSETEKKSEEQQPTYAAPAAKEQGSATNTEAGDKGKQESHPETKEEEANSSEQSEPATKTQSEENSVNGDSSSPKSEGEGTKSEEASSKPKVRKRRDADPVPPATAADADLDANQTYTAPEDGASVDDLATKLNALPETVENEKKLANIDQVGDTKGINPGKIQEIDEFGGWTAVTSEGTGKFAVARKTEAGVFPLETVNTVKKGTSNYQTWTEETSFDTSSNYALFLSKVRTEKTKEDTTFDGEPYKYIGEGGDIAKGLKGFNGIEKTFKVYSPSIGSSAKISFKIGYTGDINGTKAKYRVELIGNKDGAEKSLYSVNFDPQVDKRNEDMTVVAAKNGTSRRIDTPISNDSYSKIKAKLEEIANRPNGQAGTFTSKDIDIPKGYTSYKVRISSADNQRLGMGYQVTWDHYALPIVGNGFAVTQDTKKVAKDLAEKVYDKLTEQKEEDTKWSTSETKDAYDEKLQKIKDKIDSEASTSDYKTVVEEALEKQKNLNEEKKIKHKAADEIAEKAAEKLVEIDDDDTLSENEKRIATEKVIAEAEKAAQKVKIAIDQNGVEEAKTEGIDAITKVNPVGRDKAKKAIQDELDKKEAEIEGNDQLSPDEKAAAKKQAQAAADKAKEAIDQQPATADTPEAATQAQTAVTTAQTTGEADIKKVNPVGRD
ncbi:YSIRK-type signal peptide-containing protein, partial [Streptococcus sp. 1969]|uniref:YSIRK-type signal peptide-containing protein n=1 Tax=Streptococcus sp. 1969 TaxID=2582688 RepID=UPI0015627CBF